MSSVLSIEQMVIVLVVMVVLAWLFMATTITKTGDRTTNHSLLTKKNEISSAGENKGIRIYPVASSSVPFIYRCFTMGALLWNGVNDGWGSVWNCVWCVYTLHCSRREGQSVQWRIAASTWKEWIVLMTGHRWWMPPPPPPSPPPPPPACNGHCSADDAQFGKFDLIGI